MIKPILLLSACYSANALSQITVNESLNFGTIVIAKNTPGSSITLFPNGSSTGNNIYRMKNGHPAELLFEGYGAGVQINITDIGYQPSLKRVNGGNEFILTRLIYSNSVITTNSRGTAILRIGGELSVSGNGQPYLDDSYSTLVELVISY